MKPLCLLIAATLTLTACAAGRAGPPVCDGARRQPVNTAPPDALAASPADDPRC